VEDRGRWPSRQRSSLFLLIFPLEGVHGARQHVRCCCCDLPSNSIPPFHQTKKKYKRNRVLVLLSKHSSAPRRNARHLQNTFLFSEVYAGHSRRSNYHPDRSFGGPHYRAFLVATSSCSCFRSCTLGTQGTLRGTSPTALWADMRLHTSYGCRAVYFFFQSKASRVWRSDYYFEVAQQLRNR
jgi:hypothetical protein